ncbi:uncharacterized protein LOC135172690 [Diachasmimorpha longicaudata]|uniref:uncharacterized protein LOC135172690 n=1 Tax=Diachasmimorpha longicaudata TaxID=58733 RepID=UPI0030B8F30F
MKTLLHLTLKYLVIVMCTRVFKAFHTSEPAWSADLMNYIKKNKDHYRQVMIITYKDPEIPFENYWIRAILHTAAETYPTIRINFDWASDMKEEKSLHRTDATATLFIFVDDGDMSRTIPPEHIISIMKILSLNKKIVKYLGLFLSSTQTMDFNDLLRHAWKNQMTDVTILELIGCRRVTETILNTCIDDNSLPIIHQFNPFLNITMRKVYQPDMELFPDIMKNMHGYGLKIAVRNHPPFSHVIWTNSTYKAMWGMDISLIQTIAEIMNFTMKIIPQLITFGEIRDESTPGLFKFLRSGKVDIIASPYPHHTEDMEENSFRSETLLRDQLCAVVPLRNTVRILFPKALTEALILTIGIVLIFWFSKWVFRFPSSWSIFTTIRVLFGIPVFTNYDNLKPAQRVIIQILMIISLFYSANIYASLTTINIDLKSEILIENLDDLDKSGYVLKVDRNLMNKTFGNFSKNDVTMVNLKRKAIPIRRKLACLEEAEKFKNTTCLMTHAEGDWYIKSRHADKSLSMSSACFWSDSYAFLFREGSPYRQRIDYLIRRLAEVGIPIRWMRNETVLHLSATPENDLWQELKIPAPGVLRDQLIAVLFFGLTTAIMTFIGEILWYHCINK